MSQKILLISLSATIILINGCKPSETPKNSGTDDVWKATISYCIGREGMEKSMFINGAEYEVCDIYNFKVLNQEGNYHDLMKMLYNDAISGKHPMYDVDVVNNLCPTKLLSDSAIAAGITTIDRDSTGKLRKIKIMRTNSAMRALDLNQEWYYNFKTNNLSAKITDAGLSIDAPGLSYMYTMGTFKFSPRANDSVGPDQVVCSPGIVWARDIELPIEYDSLKGMYLHTYNPGGINNKANIYQMDGNSSIAFMSWSTVLKTMFNKKLAWWIWNAANKGLLPAYSYEGNGKVGAKLSVAQIKNAGMTKDTVMTPNGKDTVVTDLVDPNYLAGLQVIEEISFNKSTYTFDSKITYAAILMHSINYNTGISIPNKTEALYWVKFE